MQVIEKKIGEIALLCKKKEIEALEKAKNFTDTGYVYWDAKAQAFSQIWEFIVFNGKSVGNGVSPEEYNIVNEEWSEFVNDEKNNF